MAVLEFSRRDVEALARKLDSLQHELSAYERALLAGIFAAARTRVLRVEAEDSDHPEPTQADLREQILKAFLPAEGNEFILANIGRISGDPIVRH